MLGKLMVIVVVLVLTTLLAAPLLLAQQDATDRNEPAQEPIVVTGILENAGITTYFYGTHAITDEASGTRYALSSENVDLQAYEDQRVTVYGTPVPGYQNGAVEGGPDLLDVTRVDGAPPSPPFGPSGTGFEQYRGGDR